MSENAKYTLKFKYFKRKAHNEKSARFATFYYLNFANFAPI